MLPRLDESQKVEQEGESLPPAKAPDFIPVIQSGISHHPERDDAFLLKLNIDVTANKKLKHKHYLIFVVDCSSSMAIRVDGIVPLEALKRAICDYLRQLPEALKKIGMKPEDMDVSVVAFADEADILLAHGNIQAGIKAISDITVSRGTCSRRGLLTAATLVVDPSNTTIPFFTDGCDSPSKNICDLQEVLKEFDKIIQETQRQLQLKRHKELDDESNKPPGEPVLYIRPTIDATGMGADYDAKKLATLGTATETQIHHVDTPDGYKTVVTDRMIEYFYRRIYMRVTVQLDGTKGEDQKKITVFSDTRTPPKGVTVEGETWGNLYEVVIPKDAHCSVGTITVKAKNDIRCESIKITPLKDMELNLNIVANYYTDELYRIAIEGGPGLMAGLSQLKKRIITNAGYTHSRIERLLHKVDDMLDALNNNHSSNPMSTNAGIASALSAVMETKKEKSNAQQNVDVIAAILQSDSAAEAQSAHSFQTQKPTSVDTASSSGESKPQKSPAAWNIEEVSDWIGTLALPASCDKAAVQQAFKDSQIDGSILFELEDSILQHELGIAAKIPRLIIRKEISKLALQAASMAAEAEAKATAAAPKTAAQLLQEKVARRRQGWETIARTARQDQAAARASGSSERPDGLTATAPPASEPGVSALLPGASPLSAPDRDRPARAPDDLTLLQSVAGQSPILTRFELLQSVAGQPRGSSGPHAFPEILMTRKDSNLPSSVSRSPYAPGVTPPSQSVAGQSRISTRFELLQSVAGQPRGLSSFGLLQSVARQTRDPIDPGAVTDMQITRKEDGRGGPRK